MEIFISGCKEHPCENCHNPELWEEIGEEINYDELKKGIDKKIELIDNFFITGGEVLEKSKEEVIELIEFLKPYNKNVWLFTRFNIEEVDKDILDKLDYIKCGMYLEEFKGQTEQFGVTLNSTNQKVYKLNEV